MRRHPVTSTSARPRRLSPSPRRRPDDRTHAPVDGVVVFHIGMTIRAPHRPDLWLPVFRAMPQMLAELHRNAAAAERGEAEDLGFLGAETLLGRRGPWVVQYWRSTDHLYAYAREPERLHVPAWKRFNAAARRNPEAVGIWHETFVAPAGGIETIYGNGALVGLGRAVGTIPRTARTATARDRLRADTVELPPAPGGEHGATDPVRPEDLEPS